MKIIGLTGSIGMGKSATASLLRLLKIPVFDSDACVHDLLERQAMPLVINAFPEAWDKRVRRIDRAVLGRIIFSNPVAKHKLESILHPMVWAEQQKFIAKCRRAGQKMVVLDIPLLFESGRDRICDNIISVSAPPFLQRHRVLSRKGMTPEKYKAIVTAQYPDHHKKLQSDHIVPTGLGKAFTLKKLKKILGSDL